MLTRSHYLSVCAVLGLTLTADSADARSFRVNQVPNGSRFGCATCHNDPAGGGLRNGFGAQVENSLIGVAATADVDWAAIYDRDGDSDGYSNGRELGDPDGTWTIGSSNPSGDTYAPYDRNDSPCGDGVLENPPEDCDGDELPPDMACEDFGWGPGTLSCSSTCRINQEACQGYTVTIPNNSNPPNNTTTPTNNMTSGGTNSNMTTGETNNTTGQAEAEDEGGCSTTVGTQLRPPVWLLLGLVGLGGLRRRARTPLKTHKRKVD